MLPTGATNRSGILPSGRAQSSWRDEKADTSMGSLECDILEGSLCTMGQRGRHKPPSWGGGSAGDEVWLSGQIFAPALWNSPSSLLGWTCYVCSDHKSYLHHTHTLSTSFSIRTIAKDWGPERRMNFAQAFKTYAVQ